MKYNVMEYNNGILYTIMTKVSKEEIDALGQVERPIYQGGFQEEVGFIVIGENKRYYVIKSIED